VLSKRQILGALLLFFLLPGFFSLNREAAKWPFPGAASRLRLEWTLFGLAPVKQVHLEQSPEVRLIPGGQSIGILLRTQGAMVVGFSPVIEEDGQIVFPAKDAGMEVGDVILAINGHEMTSDEEVRETIVGMDSYQAGMDVRFKRKGIIRQTLIYPRYCKETQSMRIGLFIRDNAGGIGTLTFYEPQRSVYGALGHVIADAYSNAPIDIRQGEILPAKVADIRKGSKGTPGEKVGVFMEHKVFGDVSQNERCGIYGTLSEPLKNPLYASALPIAYSYQIQPGKAHILTVVSGQEIQAFDIWIERILLGKDDGRNMLVRIVDPRLLSVTGGIIQGMSGSPIIQNNKIAGAVTHVFVNDPTRGYGVFIENMLMESGVLPSKAVPGHYAPGTVCCRAGTLFCRKCSKSHENRNHIRENRKGAIAGIYSALSKKYLPKKNKDDRRNLNVTKRSPYYDR
jgi:stage IV sporulation protein B